MLVININKFYLLTVVVLNKENEFGICSQFYNSSSLVYVNESTNYDNINAALSKWAGGLSGDVDYTCYLHLLYSTCLLLYPPCDGDDEHVMIMLCFEPQCLDYITDNCGKVVRILSMHPVINHRQSLCVNSENLGE